MEPGVPLSFKYNEYSDDKQALDLYLPQENAKDCMVAWVHGGAWITSDRSDFRSIGRKLVEIGFPTAILGYRITKEDTEVKSVFPDAVEDVANGIEWLWHNIASVKGNRPSKIILVGHSAGCQITGLVSLQAKWISNEPWNWISGVIAIEGIFDIPSLAESHPNFVPWFLTKQFPDENLWNEASPQLVPIERKNLKYLIIYSKNDEYQMEDQSVNFFRRLKGLLDVTYNDKLGGSHDGILELDCLYCCISQFINNI